MPRFFAGYEFHFRCKWLHGIVLITYWEHLATRAMSHCWLNGRPLMRTTPKTRRVHYIGTSAERFEEVQMTASVRLRRSGCQKGTAQFGRLPPEANAGLLGQIRRSLMHSRVAAFGAPPAGRLSIQRRLMAPVISTKRPWLLMLRRV